jgi:ubiquitin C-terminal hydrolase
MDLSLTGPMVPLGLLNHGATCFLSATLQCLLHTPALMSIVLMRGSILLSWEKRKQKQKCFVELFQDLAKGFWLSSSADGHGHDLALGSLVKNISRLDWQFRPKRQQDAHEFVRGLLDRMHEEMLQPNGPVSEPTFVSHIFGGCMRTVHACPSCGCSSKKDTAFLDMSLPLHGVQTVAEAVKAHLRGDCEWIQDPGILDPCILCSVQSMNDHGRQQPGSPGAPAKKAEFGIRD